MIIYSFIYSADFLVVLTAEHWGKDTASQSEVVSALLWLFDPVDSKESLKKLKERSDMINEEKEGSNQKKNKTKSKNIYLIGYF